MLNIQEMQSSDLNQVTKLVTQLGYDGAESEVAERFRFIKSLPGHKLFVAYENDLEKIAGWIHIFQFTTLEMSLATELGGLVVDTAMRRKGVGRALMLAAEKWSLENGIYRLQFTSQTKRVEAHAFYQKLGYVIIKNSYYFSKDLRA